jgi:hypothetical protein
VFLMSIVSPNKICFSIQGAKLFRFAQQDKSLGFCGKAFYVWFAFLTTNKGCFSIQGAKLFRFAQEGKNFGFYAN